MSRKETITRDDLLKAAFEMTREQGSTQVTARKLAVRAGCSTQPIFRIYRNMEELYEDLYHKTVDCFAEYCRMFPRKNPTPFADLGLSYIRFAREEPNLFRLLFLSEDRHGMSMYELLNGPQGEVMREIARAQKNGCQDPQNMFMKMWIFIHGAACMSLTGDYDLEQEDTVRLLEESYRAYRV